MYVHDGLQVARRLQNGLHKPSAACKCMECSEDRQNLECENPHACAVAVAVECTLSRLLPKWDPNRAVSENEPSPAVSRDVFRLPPQITSLADGFRVLTKQPRGEVGPASRPPERWALQPDTKVIVFIGSNEVGKTIAGGVVWWATATQEINPLRYQIK